MLARSYSNKRSRLDQLPAQFHNYAWGYALSAPLCLSVGMGTRNVHLEETDRTFRNISKPYNLRDVARVCLETATQHRPVGKYFIIYIWFNYFQANYHEICAQYKK